MSALEIAMGALLAMRHSTGSTELRKDLMQLLGDKNDQVVVQIMTEVNQFRDLEGVGLARVAESNKVEQRKLRTKQSTLLNTAETSKKCSSNGMAESPHESSDNKKNDKKKPPNVATDSFSPRRRRKKTRVSEMASIIQNCGRESVMSSPPNNRRVSNKRTRGKAKSPSPYASTPNEELLVIYHAAVVTKDGIKTLARGLVDELRERSHSEQTMSDAHFDQFKQATIDGLVDAAVRGETGDITPDRMEPYCAKIRSAKRGQRFDLLMLLCPKKVEVNGEEKLISVRPGDELPPDFDPKSCATTRVLFEITDDLEEEEYMTDDVRGNCQCGANGRCKKCTEDEGSACAEVYNRFALFFYVTGGDMSFYNLGGTTTCIKENLVSKLDRHYFRTVFESGQHLSCATYLVKFYGTFENGAACMTSYLKHVCDMLGIPQAFDRMVADDDIPMIVDMNQMAHHKRIWKAGLSKEDKEDIESWKVEKKERMSWLNTHCKEPTGSMSITSEFVLPAARSYAEIFEDELLERNGVDSLDNITVSMVQSMQATHGGNTLTKKMVTIHGLDNDGKSIHFKGIGETGGIETQQRYKDAKTRVAKNKASDKDRERIKRRSEGAAKASKASHVTRGHANWSPYNHNGDRVDPEAELQALAANPRFRGMHKGQYCFKWSLVQESDINIYLNDGNDKRGDKATIEQANSKWKRMNAKKKE